jgi:hypothetical protein
VDQSCDLERALHAQLAHSPRAEVDPAALEQLADPDARDSYAVALALRELLLTHESIEEAYLRLAGGGWSEPLPGASLDLLAQLLVRHVLRESCDPYCYRAAELWFRNQRASVTQGIQLVDHLTLARRRPLELTPLGQLIHKVCASIDQNDLPFEVLSASNGAQYADRAEAHDFALDLALRGPGMAGLCEVLAAWVGHFCGAGARVTPLQRIDDPEWVWHIGLDAHSNELLNALYRGETPDSAARASLLSLFRLDFEPGAPLRPELAARPIYLGLAMDPHRVVALKPQNLLLNLPLRAQA